MIDCLDIAINYGQLEVLRNFSARIAPATITAIIGENGVGKSTLLAALAGDIKPQSGEIRINNHLLSEISIVELSKIRSLAQQSHNYWMAYTTQEILRLGHIGISEKRFSYLIEKLGLNSYLNQSVTTLSGGQLQRIEIVRALLRELPLVLLDEPFASQDLQSIAAIKEVLIAERAAGRTIVLVTHTRREDLAWCDQIIELTAK